MTQKHITIVAFCGPSGSGKSELIQRLLDLYPDNVCKWMQATTRTKRGPGDDYVFMTKPMYDVVRSTLTCRTEFNGNYYGTFPEPVNAETAVLTIADAMGLSDLIADVSNHNNHVNNGHIGKLGDNPVKLVTVLMTYTLSDDEIEKRNGTRNGTRNVSFLQSELDKLNGIDFDFVLDTTGDRWTQPEQFFSEAIWPAICSPIGADTFESLYAQIEHQLIEVGEGCRAVRDLDALRGVLATLRGAAEYVNEWVNSEPEGGNDVDDIDAVLSGAAAPIVEAAAVVDDGTALVDPHGFDEAEEIYRQSLARAGDDEEEEAEQQHPSDYLNDRTPENTPDAVAEEPVPETPLTVEADPVEVAAVEPEPVVEEVPTAALKPYAEIFAESDFTDWMLNNTIGLEAFEDEAKFKLIFSQYVSANGGNPNDIQVGFQATKDGKGGRVVGYTAIMPDGSRYGVEFNERIKQVVKYGPL